MRTIADPLGRGFTISPASPAVVDSDSGRAQNFSKLDRRCRALAAAIAALGLGRGDRIALLIANGHAYIESYVALHDVSESDLAELLYT